MALVIKPKRKFTAGAPTTSDIVEGEIAINTADKKLYVRDNAGAIIEIGGAAGTTAEITQSSHGFDVQDAIYHTGSAWAKAQANSVNTLALGIVIEKTTNTFVVAQSGRFELTSHGLVAGQWYYLSAAAAGDLVTTEPTISQPIVFVEGSNHIFVFAYRPTNLLINGSSSVIPGDNTVSTVKIQDDAVTADKLANSINTDIAAALPKAGGAMTGAITTNSTFDGRDVGTDGTKLDGIAASANNYVHPNHSGEVTSTADGATVIASDIVDEDNLKISNGGSDGNFLQKQSGNTGGLTWAAAGGAYSDWEVKTSGSPLTAATKDQLLINSGSAYTVNLPAGSDGNTIIICNAGAGLVTISPNGSEKINSSTDDGTLPQGNSAQLVYAGSTIGWFEV